jgi:membrane-associated phospholipid phosphatase
VGAAPAAALRPAVAATARDAHNVVSPVIAWNRVLLGIVRTPGAQPATVHSTRSFALLHAAFYDAVNAIDRTHRPYLVQPPGVARSASVDAAAASAAHDVLVALYPAVRQLLDDELAQELAQIHDSESKTDGVRVGQMVAARVLAALAEDGSAASPVAFVFGNAPGDYQSTPPNFPAQPVFTHWSHVKPFALASASQFRPGPPPALTSDAYAAAVNEIQRVGVANGTTASPDQALTGRFWNGPIQNYWNEIAQSAALSRHLTTAESARLFALLNFALADGVIAFYDAKYTYNLWRPVSAIRGAAADGNANTVADAAWLPAVGTSPADPSYPGAHAVLSAAAAAVLANVLRANRIGIDVTSEVLPGVTRSFERLSDAAREASLSRMYAGVHFRFDLAAGDRLGRDVARVVTDQLLLPRFGHHARNDAF